MFDLSQRKIDIACPECSAKTQVNLEQVANQETIVCPGCGKKIDLVDKDGSVKKSIVDVNEAIDGLNDAIRRFGK